MIRHRCVSFRRQVVPNLVAPRSLAVEGESVSFELANNLTVSESGKPSHLSRDHDRVIVAVRGSRER